MVRGGLQVRVIGEAEWDGLGQVRRLEGACHDISESKRAAEAARWMAGQLTTTLESFTYAFLTVDRNWRLTYVNAEAELCVASQPQRVDRRADAEGVFRAAPVGLRAALPAR